MKKRIICLAITMGLLLPVVIHAQTNIAPLGTAYTWAHNLESTADSNKVACAELNDENPDSIIWLSRGVQGEGIDDIINAWQAAGVVWETAHEISEVVYINGPYDGTVYANGAFSKEESFRLQISKDGSTWEDVKIYEEPTYTYFDWEDAQWGALVTDQPFSFKGEIGVVMGVRVTGVVHNWEAGSWNATCRQILAYSNDTAIKNQVSLSPKQFEIYQNYPNPYNSTTRIRFDLPEARSVTVQIYTLQGQLVTTLIESRMAAGSHEIEWKSTGLPSGVYLCRLRSRDFGKTIKMVLQR